MVREHRISILTRGKVLYKLEFLFINYMKTNLNRYHDGVALIGQTLPKLVLKQLWLESAGNQI